MYGLSLHNGCVFIVKNVGLDIKIEIELAIIVQRDWAQWFGIEIHDTVVEALCLNAF